MPQDRYGVRDLAAPWYAGSASFLRAPWVQPTAAPPGDVAIAGMPVDQFATSVGHTGMRLGPRRIREASLFLAGYHGIQADIGISDFGSGVVWAWPDRLPLVDTGDVPIIPHDVAAQVAAAADHIAAASRTSGLTVTLGGDHFVAYPATLGVSPGSGSAARHQARLPAHRLAHRLRRLPLPDRPDAPRLGRAPRLRDSRADEDGLVRRQRHDPARPGGGHVRARVPGGDGQLCRGRGTRRRHEPGTRLPAGRHRRAVRQRRHRRGQLARRAGDIRAGLPRDLGARPDRGARGGRPGATAWSGSTCAR